jgi:hypothetical protein
MEFGDRLFVRGLLGPTEFAAHPDGLLRIGDGVRVGQCATLSASLRVEIEDYVRVGNVVYIADSSFTASPRTSRFGSYPLSSGAAPGSGTPARSCRA